MNSGPCPAESSCIREVSGQQSAATNVTNRPSPTSTHRSVSPLRCIQEPIASPEVGSRIGAASSGKQRRANPMAGHISECHDHLSIRQQLAVIIVSTSLIRRLVLSSDLETLNSPEWYVAAALAVWIELARDRVRDDQLRAVWPPHGPRPRRAFEFRLLLIQQQILR